MKKINLFKICLVLMLLCAFVLTGCKQPVDEPNEDGTVTAKTEVHTVNDIRDEVYEFHAADGSLISTHRSLYEAINACVNDGDTEDYVLRNGDSQKLFINYDKYADNSEDMFWYYENGTTLLEYTAWKSSYWQDLKAHGDAITVFKNSANGTVQYYYNSHELIKTHSDPNVGAGTTQVWNVSQEVEANITVDMKAYSGITKAVYTIKLSEAKITPSMSEDTHAWPFIGFMTADSYNQSGNGLKCDSTTGNWYYYSGEITHTANSSEVDMENCYLTSTWDEANQCFRPDGDVTLTMELLTLLDDDNEEYIVHRLTMDFGNGRVVTKDYEISSLTQCGTVRFHAGIDLESDNDLQDYMCGASFENLVITSAVATVYEEMLDFDNYGNFAEISVAGDYDILNSNPETAARYHTIVYNPACVDYDFSQPGRDVYGFTFLLDSDAPSLSEHITDVIDAIEALPSVDELTDEDAERIHEVRDMVDGLVDTQMRYIHNLSKLEALEAALGTERVPTLSYTYIDANNLEAGGDVFEAVYDSETGLYTITQAFIQWGRITALTIDGKVITSENTTIQGGAYNGAVYANGDQKLYQDLIDSDASTFFNSASQATYILVYDPVNNTLTVEVPAVEGLSYAHTSGSGVATLDSATGTWELELAFNQWNRISFKYNGVDITIDNTTVTGAFLDSYPNGEAKLYVDLVESDNKTFINSTTSPTTYHFSYDPETNTLTISVATDDDQDQTDPATIKVNTVNVDAGGDAIAVWNVAGTKLKEVTDATTGATTWLGNGWRYFVVVDSEGKITYAVSMPPNGYGGPNGNGYYCHPDYNDYTTNPTFNILEGFGPWVQGGFAHNLFEVVVPEGGFAITAHGTGINTLVQLLSGGTITNAGDSTLPVINARTAFSENIRISYNPDTQELTIK